jgi:hypothetical protein
MGLDTASSGVLLLVTRLTASEGAAWWVSTPTGVSMKS